MAEDWSPFDRHEGPSPTERMGQRLWGAKAAEESKDVVDESWLREAVERKRARRRRVVLVDPEREELEP